MKRYLGWALLALNVLLFVLLVWMWFKPNGELKNAQWQPPRGQKANLDGLVPPLGKPQAMDTSQFLAMLDRPLFSLSRRPPPPPPPPVAEAPPPPPDYLADAVLTGVYTTGNGRSGGVIITFQGKSRSLPLQAALDGWVLNSIAENRVYFSRGGQTKEITLQKAKLQTDMSGTNTNTNASPPRMPPPNSDGSVSAPPRPARSGASLGGS